MQIGICRKAATNQAGRSICPTEYLYCARICASGINGQDPRSKLACAKQVGRMCGSEHRGIVLRLPGAALTMACFLVRYLRIDVRARSQAETAGVACLTGMTGAYPSDFGLINDALVLLAQRGRERSSQWVASARLIGSALIYFPGLL